MGSVLHGSARTTPRIRAELKAAQAPARLLASQYGLNVKTVLKWRNRTETTDAPMGPKPKSTFHFPGMFVELDVGELRDPVDGKEHHELAVCVREFGAVDVDISNVVSFEQFPLFRVVGQFERLTAPTGKYSFTPNLAAEGPYPVSGQGVAQMLPPAGSPIRRYRI